MKPPVVNCTTQVKKRIIRVADPLRDEESGIIGRRSAQSVRKVYETGSSCESE